MSAHYWIDCGASALLLSVMLLLVLLLTLHGITLKKLALLLVSLVILSHLLERFLPPNTSLCLAEQVKMTQTRDLEAALAPAGSINSLPTSILEIPE